MQSNGVFFNTNCFAGGFRLQRESNLAPVIFGAGSSIFAASRIRTGHLLLFQDFCFQWASNQRPAVFWSCSSIFAVSGYRTSDLLFLQVFVFSGSRSLYLLFSGPVPGVLQVVGFEPVTCCFAGIFGKKYMCIIATDC